MKTNPSITISTAPLEYPAMDYAFLRSQGIRLLERLGGQLWTDFNTHDPGITILEQLCYAITDLGYRINYDIKDLLASGKADPYRSLYSPARVLTTYPVTLTDLRKLVIDVPGVKNAWVEPAETSDPGLVYDPAEANLYLETSAPQPPHRVPVPLRGLYRVLIETDTTSDLHPTDILPEVNRRLQACRSLCGDFNPPLILPGQKIVVDAEIEIGAVEDPERLLAEIYHRLANSISPRIHFHTLTEMLDQGKNIDDIFDGPALEHGFIDNAELEQFQRKVGLRTSDLIQEIMNVNGVVTVNTIGFPNGSQTEKWYLKLDPNSAPYLDINTSLFPDKPDEPTIRLARAGLQVQLKPDRVGSIIKSLQQAAGDQPLPESERDFRIPLGQDRKIGQYHSFQHQFPAAYGISTMGLPESASPQRKAQASQLKAYLMFFDQLLANYCAQLANAKDLFSFYAQPSSTDFSRTYFCQMIENADLDLSAIRSADLNADLDLSEIHSADLNDTKLQTITDESTLGADITPDTPAYSERKNRFLNHLLARFAEQFTDYSLLQYASLSPKDLITDKCAFLQDYPAIGAARGTGFNYTLPSWDSENVSGLEKRIGGKLGIPCGCQQDLAGMDGGFHVLEHILLRPRPADNRPSAQTTAGISWQTAFLAQLESRDPYSHQLSFVFPNWIERFNEPGFPDLIQKTLREETPAHIRIYIHWLDKATMGAYESAWKEWLETVIASRSWDPINTRPDDIPTHLTQLKLRDARDRMIQILGIGTAYPLRDVILDYPETVVFGNSTKIQILGAQAGVRYQLCNEDGNVIIVKNRDFEVLPDSKQVEGEIYLNTPPIRKDITFTILATRTTKNPDRCLQTYLNQVVSIKAGIDTRLQVAFQPAGGRQITINYGDKVTVKIFKSQEGISYKLVAGTQDLSKPVKGDRGDISLVSADGFLEDASINILAYRTSYSRTSALLDIGLSVLVRPNSALAIHIDRSIVDYETGSVVTLVAPQASAEYHLYKRDVVPAEYAPDGTPGSLVVQTDEGRNISVKVPAKITDWNAPAGFALVDVFQVSHGSLSVNTGSLLEDTLFIVQATKIKNREQLQLDQAVVILVRPNPAPAVSVAQPAVKEGTSGLVLVNRTQKGVGYQLRLDRGNKPVNPPGYHLTDRGVETTRLEVDFIVEDQGKAVLLLPTGAITKATTFNVLAIKTMTGVSAELNDTVTIDIPAP